MVYITKCYVLLINVYLIIANFTLTFYKVILQNFQKKIKIMLKFELKRDCKSYLPQYFFSEIKLPNFYRFAVKTLHLPVVLDALLQTMVQFSLKDSLKHSDTDPSSLHIIKSLEAKQTYILNENSAQRPLTKIKISIIFAFV